MKSADQPQEIQRESEVETSREGRISYLCMKYNRRQEGQNVTCQDPGLYCKFRPSCLIHYQEKRRRRREASSDVAEK